MKKIVINFLDKKELDNPCCKPWYSKEYGFYVNLKINECYIVKEENLVYRVIDNRKGKVGLKYFDNVLKCFSWLYNKK